MLSLRKENYVEKCLSYQRNLKNRVRFMFTDRQPDFGNRFFFYAFETGWIDLSNENENISKAYIREI